MKTKYIVYLVFSLLLGSACSDFMEVVPVARVTEGEIFTDISRSQQFLNPAYANVSYRPMVSLEYCTDNSVSNGGAVSAGVTGGTAEASAVEGQWNSAISMIMQT